MSHLSNAFQRLRPACVSLNQAAVRLQSGTANSEELVQKLEELRLRLSEVGRLSQSLDENLAEYVFIPLSHVFKQSAQTTNRSLEIAVNCLEILLATGWQSIQEPRLATQLFLLLTFLAAKSLPSMTVRSPSDMLGMFSFKCLCTLFDSLGRSNAVVKDFMLQASNIPAIGHAITTMLEAAKQTRTSAELQNSALEALISFQNNIATPEVAMSFLPGILSSLSHIIAPSTSSRRSYKVLATALIAVRQVLSLTVTDERCQSMSSHGPGNMDTDDWLTQTSEKVKLALLNLIKVRTHPKKEVKIALQKVCILVIKNCRQSLPGSVQPMLELYLALYAEYDTDPDFEYDFECVLSDVFLLEIMRTILYERAKQLPFLITGGTDTRGTETIRLLSVAMPYMQRTGMDLTIIEKQLEYALNEILLRSFQDSKAIGVWAPGFADAYVHHQTQSSREQSPLIPLFARTEKEQMILRDANAIVQVLSDCDASAHFALDCLQGIYTDNPRLRLINFWKLLKMFDVRIRSSSTISLFVRDEAFEDDAFDHVADKLYSLSIELTLDQTQADWGLKLLSIEFLKLRARQLGSGFRNCLVDSLFPVINSMGAPNKLVSSAATDCINSIAMSCNYADAADLIISNIDYLTNAIGLTFGSLNITPQACQVLVLMVNLYGASLVPYLDDVINALFEALEGFHGYTKMVEAIFAVLQAIVEQVVANTSTSRLPSSKAIPSTQTLPSAKEISQLTSYFTEKSVKDRDDSIFNIIQRGARDPSRQLGRRIRSQSGSLVADPEPRHEVDAKGVERSEEMFSNNDIGFSQPFETVRKILVLTQHHLASASPVIRASLLMLLRVGLPYIATQEDAFLPLVNTLWPTIIHRLKDKEHYVVARTFNVIGIVCDYAGDFMKGRIEALWPDIRIIVERLYEVETAHKSASQGPILTTSFTPEHEMIKLSRTNQITGGSSVEPAQEHSWRSSISKVKPPTPYIPANISTLRLAANSLLLSVLNSVQVSEMIFDYIMNMNLQQSSEFGLETVRTQMKTRNSDSAWLVSERASLVTLDNGHLGQRGRRPIHKASGPAFAIASH